MTPEALTTIMLRNTYPTTPHMKKSIIVMVKLTCLVLVDYEHDARASYCEIRKCHVSSKSEAACGCAWEN